MRFPAVFIAPLLFFLHCARQVGPSGGPPDTTPPEIIQTVPAPGQVRVPLESFIEMEFSEKIDRKTFENAVFIAPNPGEMKMKFKGRKVQLQFEEKLLPDRTYVLTIGTDLRDNHNVQMATSYTLAFSTGDSLDKGEIRGNVLSDKAQGVYIWGYILTDSSAMADPTRKEGTYSTQVGKDGTFNIQYLATGNYRLFAVNDQARNGLYDRMEDEIGMSYRDIRIDSTALIFTGLNLRMTREDTIAPALSHAGMANKSTIETQFDDYITAADTSWLNYFKLKDKASGKRLNIREIVRSPLDTNRFYLRIDPISTADTLELCVENVVDRSNNPIDTAFACQEFSATATADTAAPRLMLLTPADSSRLVEGEKPVRAVFNEWMQVADSAVGLVVRHAEKGLVKGKLEWETPYSLAFTPESALTNAMHVIELERGKLRDLSGNALFDTSGTRVFWPLNSDTLSSIAGTISVSAADSGSAIQLLAKNTSNQNKINMLKLERAGPYSFENLMPGVYLIEGFFDRNGNGKYDYGSPAPFKPAERYFTFADSIKIKSKWPNEGNDFKIQ